MQLRPIVLALPSRQMTIAVSMAANRRFSCNGPPQDPANTRSCQIRIANLWRAGIFTRSGLAKDSSDTK
jgi:hypothetical protein